MLLFDNMTVKPPQNIMIDYSIHKILLHHTVFEHFRLLFIQLIFMYKVWKCPKHSGSVTLSQLAEDIILIENTLDHVTDFLFKINNILLIYILMNKKLC